MEVTIKYQGQQGKRVKVEGAVCMGSWGSQCFMAGRHYKWALSQMFDVKGYSAVIIVEDDLDIAPVRAGMQMQYPCFRAQYLRMHAVTAPLP